jgi:Thylakoid formation protein
MYSRYFGIGMLKIMELTGQEMDKDEVYPVMEDWMTTQLGKSHITACVSNLLIRATFFI